jgi:hypothetical protein
MEVSLDPTFAPSSHMCLRVVVVDVVLEVFEDLPFDPLLNTLSR